MFVSKLLLWVERGRATSSWLGTLRGTLTHIKRVACLNEAEYIAKAKPITVQPKVAASSSYAACRPSLVKILLVPSLARVWGQLREMWLNLTKPPQPSLLALGVSSPYSHRFPTNPFTSYAWICIIYNQNYNKGINSLGTHLVYIIWFNTGRHF